ncbi:MAG: DUF4189 domain-containing protein [Ignavibacteria bacterium]|nr:DUF4189 domain-containing protein [Ignavibacteria bacterium]
MKKLFLIISAAAIITAFAPKLFSQSAVYFCTETGAYGFAYGYSYSTVFDKAIDACYNYGGSKPVLITSTEYRGYGAIALGKDINGSRVIGAAVGFTSLSEAKQEAIRQCENYGGYDVYISDTWHDR